MLTWVQMMLAERMTTATGCPSPTMYTLRRQKSRPERVVTKHWVIGRRSIGKTDNAWGSGEMRGWLAESGNAGAGFMSQYYIFMCIFSIKNEIAWSLQGWVVPCFIFFYKFHMNYFEEADWWFKEITDHASQGWGLIQSLSWLMVSTCCPHVATSTGSGGHRE